MHSGRAASHLAVHLQALLRSASNIHQPGVDESVSINVYASGVSALYLSVLLYNDRDCLQAFQIVFYMWPEVCPGVSYSRTNTAQYSISLSLTVYKTVGDSRRTQEKSKKKKKKVRSYNRSILHFVSFAT